MNPSTRDEYIPLAHGNVTYARRCEQGAHFAPPVVTRKIRRATAPTCAYNIVHIDPLTGRAVLQYHKLQ